MADVNHDSYCPSPDTCRFSDIFFYTTLKLVGSDGENAGGWPVGGDDEGEFVHDTCKGKGKGKSTVKPESSASLQSAAATTAATSIGDPASKFGSLSQDDLDALEAGTSSAFESKRNASYSDAEDISRHADDNLQDPFFDGSPAIEASVFYKLAGIFPQTKAGVLFNIMRDVLSRADKNDRESSLVAVMMTGVFDHERMEERMGGERILARDLHADHGWIVEHFGTILEIFNARKPDVVATQIVHFSKESPFQEDHGRENYVNFILENLFGKGDVLEEGEKGELQSSGQVDIPAHWTKMSSGHALVEVDKNSREFADVIANCRIPVPIVRVVRNQNVALWRRYFYCREEIKDKG